jgi:hypothetical protein
MALFAERGTMAPMRGIDIVCIVACSGFVLAGCGADETSSATSSSGANSSTGGGGGAGGMGGSGGGGGNGADGGGGSGGSDRKLDGSVLAAASPLPFPPGTAVNAAFYGQPNDAILNEDGVCVHTQLTGSAPTLVSAGVITVTGGTSPISINFDGQDYPGFSDVTSFWTPGTTITFTAAGDVVPAFSTPLEAPGVIDVTQPAFDSAIVMNRTQDFPIAWTGNTAGVVVVSVSTVGEFITCRFPSAAGAAVVPSAVLQFMTPGPVNLVITCANFADLSLANDWEVRVALTGRSTSATAPNNTPSGSALLQ